MRKDLALVSKKSPIVIIHINHCKDLLSDLCMYRQRILCSVTLDINLIVVSPSALQSGMVTLSILLKYKA